MKHLLLPVTIIILLVVYYGMVLLIIPKIGVPTSELGQKIYYKFLDSDCVVVTWDDNNRWSVSNGPVSLKWGGHLFVGDTRVNDILPSDDMNLIWRAGFAYVEQTIKDAKQRKIDSLIQEIDKKGQ